MSRGGARASFRSRAETVPGATAGEGSLSGTSPPPVDTGYRELTDARSLRRFVRAPHVGPAHLGGPSSCGLGAQSRPGRLSASLESRAAPPARRRLGATGTDMLALQTLVALVALADPTDTPGAGALGVLA